MTQPTPMVHKFGTDGDELGSTFNPAVEPGQTLASVVAAEEPSEKPQGLVEKLRAVRAEQIAAVAELTVSIPSWHNRLRGTFQPLGPEKKKRLDEAAARIKSGNDVQARDWVCGIIGEACTGLTLDGQDVGSGAYDGFGPLLAEAMDVSPDAGVGAIVWAAFDRDEDLLQPFYLGLRAWMRDPIPKVHEPEVEGPFGRS